MRIFSTDKTDENNKIAINLSTTITTSHLIMLQTQTNWGQPRMFSETSMFSYNLLLYAFMPIKSENNIRNSLYVCKIDMWIEYIQQYEK